MSDDQERSKERAMEISMLYNISEMAQSVAYEINNPLMIINGYTKKIRKNSGSPEYQDLEKDLEAIENSGERINQIIQNLLKYSKQSMELPLEDISYSQIVLEAIDTFKLTSNDIPDIEIESETNEKISVNPMLCIQCIVNVFRRCVEHSKKSASPKLELSFRTHKDRIELVIKDNGEKLSDEVQSKMFYQTFSTESEGDAVGMGMNSSFNIAKKFKGDLYFDNSYTENAFILSFKKI